MPMYEYACSNDKCKNEFDLIVLHYETDKEELCPKCGQAARFTIRDRGGVKFLFDYNES